jgi:hypothetical protein
VLAAAAHVVGIVVAAPATLVLTWSHDTFEVLMHVLSIYRFVCQLLENPWRPKFLEGTPFGWVFAGAASIIDGGAEPSWLRPCGVTLNGMYPVNPMVFLTFAAFL